MLNHRCVKPYKVNFNYTIDTLYSTFIQNSSSDDFLSAIAKTLDIHPNDLHITGLKEGSTILTGFASSSTQ